MKRPPLSIPEILVWADVFRLNHGRWPRRNDGRVPSPLSITWQAIDVALKKGWRGLSMGLSLATLLQQKRGARHRNHLPRLSIRQILKWADAHYKRTGSWPHYNSGPIAEAPGETWTGVSKALIAGRRGLRGDTSLARLLTAKRGVPNHLDVPPLPTDKILGWAKAHFRRTGKWPNNRSGPIPEAPGETWAIVYNAMVQGNRGHRGRSDAPGESWGAIEAALRRGKRGLTSGSSLHRLLRRHRRIPS